MIELFRRTNLVIIYTFHKNSVNFLYEARLAQHTIIVTIHIAVSIWQNHFLGCTNLVILVVVEIPSITREECAVFTASGFCCRNNKHVIVFASQTVKFVTRKAANGAIKVCIIVLIIIIAWRHVRILLTSTIPQHFRCVADTNIFLICSESSLTLFKALSSLNF